MPVTGGGFRPLGIIGQSSVYRYEEYAGRMQRVRQPSDGFRRAVSERIASVSPVVQSSSLVARQPTHLVRIPALPREKRFVRVGDTEFNAAPPLAGPFWLTPGGDSSRTPESAATPDESATCRAWQTTPPRSRFEAGGHGSDRDSGPSRSPPVVQLSNSRTLRLPPSLVDRTVRIGPGSGRGNDRVGQDDTG